MTAGMPTFQQTFANCPFPEGVLAVLGECPVQVRVLKTQRTMEVTAVGAVAPEEILNQAVEVLRRTFGLNTVRVELEEPEAVPPEEAVLPQKMSRPQRSLKVSRKHRKTRNLQL